MKIWKLIDVLNWTIKFFSENNIEQPRKEAELLIAEVLEINRLELYLNFDQKLSNLEKKCIKNFVVRRANREPLQYILGKTYFYNSEIILNKSALIPRPETEILVELILKFDLKNKRIIDIGTGPGSIAIAIAKECDNCIIDAVDISYEALELAIQNATANDVKVNFFISDIFSNVKNKYDIIISNPPYIPIKEYVALQPEITNYEPKSALVADENGLYFYRKILENAKKYLLEEGILIFEIGHNQAAEIKI